MTSKNQLINSDEFNNALLEGAEHKKQSIYDYKTNNKSIYQNFYDIMLQVNEDIQRILNTKKKNRTDNDNERLLEFKNNVRAMYTQVQALSTKDKQAEEDKKSKVTKIVERIIPVIQLLRYIDSSILDDEFRKYGVELNVKKLEEVFPALADDTKKTNIKNIMQSAIATKQKALDDDMYITTDIFQSKVPIDLQFDKDTNNSGLKQSDWKKLVDVKTKILSAISDEAREKVNEKIEKIASDKQFEISRAELVRDKLDNI